jgi:glycosyltransferase involved in cell wall biosynthesis
LFERRLYPLLRRWQWPERCDHLLQTTRFTLLRDSALQMHHLAANSEFTRRQLLSLGVPAERVEVLSGGVDVQRFAPGPAARAEFGWPADAFLLLTACRLVSKKGLPLLLDAVARLSREIPSLCLAVVGDGPERASLENYARARGLASRVFWTGRIEQHSMAAAYRSADLFVLASQTARRRGGVVDVETMGRVLCEANAAGLPVLASANGGIPSVITHEENGLLFPEGDLAALCQSRCAPLCGKAALRAPTSNSPGSTSVRANLPSSIIGPPG